MNLGPVEPTQAAIGRCTPVGDVHITTGFWAERRLATTIGSLPSAIARMAEAGTLDNLRIAAGLDTGTHRGPDYADSDVYKVLETVAWQEQAGAEPADAVAAEAAGAATAFYRDAAELIVRAQREDGYLHTSTQIAMSTGDKSTSGRVRTPYARLQSSHEHYCAGHLMQAAVAGHRALRDERLLGAACRFADHLVGEFLLGDNPSLDGHPQVETALVELYRETGRTRYLELARLFVDARGHGRAGPTNRGRQYCQDHLPVRQQPTIVGHAVRALYLEAGVVDTAVETSDGELLATSVARWEDMVATKTAITGGHGSRLLGEAFGDRYELPPDLGYNETCAAVAAIQWTWRLLLATGEARFADVIERLLYNGFAASVSIDGRRFFKGNPLQRRPEHLPFEGVSRRQEWFGSACCPPSTTRLMAALHHHVATTAPGTLTLHQFIAGSLRTAVDGHRVELGVDTDYPWDGDVDITVTDSPETPWTLSVRIPAWCAGGRVTIHTEGDADAGPIERTGYLDLHRRWRPGDRLRLELDTLARLTHPHPSIDALRGCVALERGPLVYCFEQIDQPAGVAVDHLTVPTDALSGIRSAPVLDADDGSEDLPGLGRTVELAVPAIDRRPARSDGVPYLTGSPETADRPVAAAAIPYCQWDNRDGDAMRVWIPTG